MKSPLLILGASTRAAAFSAIRAGFAPVCGDMFADADLRRFATVLEVPDYPQGLAEATRKLPSMPWIYTGALENWSHQVDAVSQRHQLLGNARAVLKTCRDPWFLQRMLKQHKLPSLELCPQDAEPPRDGSWLRKPLRSSGGRAVSIWNRESSTLAEPHYFQQFQAGVPISAAFVASQDPVGQHWTELLGVSVQLSAKNLPELNAPEFGYCGSIVPGRIEDLKSITSQVCESRIDWAGTASPLRDQLRQLGELVADHCGMQGLFGIDLIWNGTSLWPIEINPRYTASMELQEQAVGKSLVKWHWSACQSNVTANFSELLRAEIHSAISSAEQRQGFFGKVVLYSNRPAIAPDLTHLISASVDFGTPPTVADIPVSGSSIECGQPVFTCLSQNIQASHLLQQLVSQAQTLWSGFL
ncbi:MAG: putative ATP-dependent carboligase [Planctomycetaceae bacterium]|nr:putative ATP-dependent carboligase [Planctomycetaceae bacterium]